MTSGSPHLVAEGTAAGEREGGEGGVDLEADIIFTSIHIISHVYLNSSGAQASAGVPEQPQTPPKRDGYAPAGAHSHHRARGAGSGAAPGHLHVAVAHGSRFAAAGFGVDHGASLCAPPSEPREKALLCFRVAFSRHLQDVPPATCRECHCRGDLLDGVIDVVVVRDTVVLEVIVVVVTVVEVIVMEVFVIGGQCRPLSWRPLHIDVSSP